VYNDPRYFLIITKYTTADKLEAVYNDPRYFLIITKYTTALKIIYTYAKFSL
jgi:hypothetical protein